MALPVSNLADQMTLTTLQRTDPSIQRILHTAAHATVHQLQGKEWAPLGIEGALYIVRDRFGGDKLVLLNRKAPENWIMALVPSLRVQSKDDQYIFLQTPPQSAFVLWFPEKQQAQLMERKITQLLHRSSPSSPSSPSSSSTTANHPFTPKMRQKHSPRKQKAVSQHRASGGGGGGDGYSAASPAGAGMERMSKEDFRRRLLEVLQEDDGELLDLLYRKFHRIF